MPRQPRLDIPHVLHPVIVRGIERRDIFPDDADKERFVGRLSTLLTKGSTKCFAWSLMRNHFHLLLMPTAVSLSETMRRLLTGYAVYFNRKWVDANRIRRAGKERAVARARAIFCCLAVREYGYTGKAAGTFSGLGSAGVSIAVRRGDEQMQKDPSILERIGEG